MIARFIYIILIILCFFLVAGWAYPAYWNWGIFNPFELALPAYTAIAIALLLLIIKPPGEMIYSRFNAVAGRIYTAFSNLPAVIRYILWIIVPAFFFYIFRVDSLIMGDGLMIVSNIRQGELISPTAYGTSLLVKMMATTFPGMASSAPENLMAIVSILCGILYIVFVYKTLALLINDNSRLLIFFFIAIFSGISVLFAGYVETYPLLLAWLSVYIYFSIKFLRNQIGAITVCLIFACGIFWHVWFLAFLPSLLFLLTDKFKILSGIHLIVITVFFIIGIYIGGQFVERSGIPLVTLFLPTDESSYVLFSPAHILDFLNLLFIAGPVMLLIGLALIFSGEKNSSNSINFLAYAFLPSLAVAFMIDPALGAARDWDLLSIFALPGILFGILLLNNTIKSKILGEYLLLPILLLGLIHVSLFLNSLNNTTKSVDRIVHILYDDPHYQKDYHDGKRIPPFSAILSNVYGLHEDGAAFMERRAHAENVLHHDVINMAGQYYNKGDYKMALEYFEKVPVELIVNPQYLFHYGRTLMMNGKYERAISLFQKVLEDTAVTDVYRAMGEAYLNMNEPQKAYESLLTGAPLTKDSLSYLADGANLLARMGHQQGAIEFYRRISNASPDYPGLDLSIAMAHHGYGKFDSAMFYYRKTLESDPESFDALIGMGKIHFGQQNLDSALVYFTRLENAYPEDINALFGMGVTYAGIGERQTAIGLLTRTIQKAPDFLQAHDMLARVYLENNQPRDAIPHWQKALNLDSNFAPAHLGMAQAYDLLEDNVNAYRELQKWLEFGNIDVNTPAAQAMLKKYKPQ